MKTNFQSILLASAALTLTLPALAQNAPDSVAISPAHAREHLPYARRVHHLNDTAKASEIIGMQVNNREGVALGKVSDVALDLESGRIVQVILATTDRLTAVPPTAFSRDAVANTLVLDADAEKIKNSPAFAVSSWVTDNDSNHLAMVYGHYGEEEAFHFIRDGFATPESQGNLGHLLNDADGVPSNPATVAADGKMTPQYSSRQDLAMIPSTRLEHVQSADKLIGKPVKNLQGQSLGKVENLLLDLPSGRVVAVLISSGRYLRMDGELSAVPPSALHFESDWSKLQLDTTRELLAGAPHFNANQWPDVTQPEYVTSIYRSYNVEPYFAPDNSAQAVMTPDAKADAILETDTTANLATNGNANADNTSRNVRDRNSRTLTPLDQGNNLPDTIVTTEIRKEIIADKDMSVNARNVKIITVNGRVTLRGPVNTEEEKRIIGKIADHVAVAGNVDNQLEVKFTTGTNQ